jgi:hypothetical protein
VSNVFIGIRIPGNLHERLEDYIAKTYATKTEVIFTALAQHLGVNEEIPLSQRVAALEAQMAEQRNLVKNSTSAI